LKEGPAMDYQNENFEFEVPTRIIYRPNGVDTIGGIIADDYSFKKVMLVYGGKSLKSNGVYDRIVKSLNDKKIEFKEYGGVKANPDIEDVVAICKIINSFNPDLILAAGGGSVLDTAKCAAVNYCYKGDPLDFNKHVVKPLHHLPVGTIITLVASGSEMSDSCVISDRKHHFKAGFNDVANCPLFSLMDPLITYTVPSYQVGIGLADMFCHTFERYFSPSHEIEPCDGLALSVLHDIVTLTPRVVNNPTDYEAKRAMMILGTIAHNGFTNYGKKKLFKVHGAEHRLSGSHADLTHGQGIALLMVPFLNINKDILKEKILKMGEMVFEIKTKDPGIVIGKLTDWINSLPIYHSFEELPMKISQEELDKAYKVLKA
jgi:hypothetical protein